MRVVVVVVVVVVGSILVVVLLITLLREADCVMIFRPLTDESRSTVIVLPARSLLVLSRAARYEYSHEIPACASALSSTSGSESAADEPLVRVSLTIRAVRGDGSDQ